MNMFTRVYGIAAPAKLTEPFDKTKASHMDAEGNWKTYYQACFPFFTTGVYYKLIADLDFDGIEYRPLGALGAENYIPFTGNIDGNGNAIKNVTITAVGDASGLFAGINGAKIENLNLVNINSDTNTFSKYAGSLCSFIFGDVSEINNVHLKESQIFGQRAGGFFSDGNTFILKNCSVDDKTAIASSQYSGAINAKNQKDRSFSYYLLTFISLSSDDNEITIKDVEYASSTYSFVIDGFSSTATVYAPSTTGDNLGLFNTGSGPSATERYVNNATANELSVITTKPAGANSVYLGLIAYTSLYTDGSNRVIVLPNEDVYNQWFVGNVEEFYTDETKNNEWNYGTNKAFVGQDGKVYLDNRLFIYDSDGLVGIEIYSLNNASSTTNGIYNEKGKFELLFIDGVVCGVLTGSTEPQA